MIISEIVPAEIYQADVEEQIPSYDNTERACVNRNKKLESGGGIYQFVGDEINAGTGLHCAPDYDVGLESEHSVGDIIYKNGVNTRVISTGTATIAKQPSEYPYMTSSFAQSSWLYRYVHLVSNITGGFTGFDHTENDTHHRLYRDTETWGWKYSISYTETETVYIDEEYDRGNITYVQYHENTGYVNAYYYGNPIYSAEYMDPSSIPVYFDGTDGNKYKIGTLEEVSALQDGTKVYFYAIYKGSEEINYIVQTEDANVVEWCDADIYEDMPVILDKTEGMMWLGTFFILENGNLYMRTSVNTAVITKDVTSNQYVSFQMLDSFPNFPYIGPGDVLRPFDGRNKTILKRSSYIHYILKSQYKFDTLAISGVIAKDVYVTFRNSAGGTIRDIYEYKPNSMRDKSGNLSKVGTTAIFYSPTILVPGDTVEISVFGVNMQVGEILLGARGYAGKTNFLFNNSGKSIAPLEQDAFGVYHNRKASVDVFKGSSEFETKDYDMIGRFVQSIDGMKIIANGSDSDEVEDGESMLAKTRVVGIFMKYTMSTKEDMKRMSDYSSLNFEIEEVV